MVRVHMVASGGGHLDLLRAVARDLPSDVEPVWCTTPGRGAQSLRAAGAEVHELPPIDLDTMGAGSALRSVRQSLGLVVRQRPRIVVTSGAGLTVPFCAAARASGARLMFLETMARVGDASKAARALSRIAQETRVQWPENAAVLPHAVVCRPVLLADVRGGPPPPGTGTYVSLGTHHGDFSRLVDLVDAAAERGLLPTPVLVQAGWTRVTAARSPDLRVVDWLPADEVAAALRTSSVVIAQAAAGIASAALREGRRPLLVARTAARSEHVDDHQVQIARKLNDLGLAVELRGPVTQQDIAATSAPLVLPDTLTHGPTMAERVARFVDRPEFRA